MVATLTPHLGLIARGVLAWILVAVGLRAVVVQPERCGDPTAASTMSAAEAAVGWLTVNQHPDGTWRYRYDRSTDTDLGGYNIVRHAGAVVALEQAASAGVAGAADVADAGTGWLIGRTIEGPVGLLVPDNAREASLGTPALWLAGLVERRERTGDREHDQLMLDLGRFIETMVQPDGSVLGRYDLVAERPIPESWSKFYTGEAFWALARLHVVFPGEGFDEVAMRIANYLPDRDEREGWWPTLPDHWAAYGFAATTEWSDPPTLTDAQIDYLRNQAALQSVQIRYESQRTESTWTHLTRGRPTLGAGLGTLGEALDQLWVVASSDPRLTDLQPAIAERGACVSGVLVRRQADDGAWYQFDITQIDDQQHTLSALLLVQPLLDDLERQP